MSDDPETVEAMNSLDWLAWWAGLDDDQREALGQLVDHWRSRR